MTDYAGLVKRLEDHANWQTAIRNAIRNSLDAADAIKALVQERDEWKDEWVKADNAINVEAERAERAECEELNNGILISELKKACVKAEAALAECMGHADAMAEVIGGGSFHNLEELNRWLWLLAECYHAFRAWRAK